jgi:hypothetical protein
VRLDVQNIDLGAVPIAIGLVVASSGSSRSVRADRMQQPRKSGFQPVESTGQTPL